MKSQDESDVGILCYISQLPGFRGILKQRYSDFIVNEVDLEGNVVHLTSLEAPPELVEEKLVKISELPKKSYDAEVEKFRALVGDCDADKLRAYIHQITSGEEVSTEPIVLSPSSDKAHRTLVHNFFKSNLNFLVTDTVDGPDTSSKCIRVRLNEGKSQGKSGSKKRKLQDRYDSRGSDSWPESQGKFLRFHLCKENKDTQEVLRLIGKMLGIQSRSFGFAGTKDKRSVSTQRVTVFKQKASRLAALNDRLIGIKVGDFCYVDEGLLLGQLLGNHFTVTLRGVVAESEDNIRASVNLLGEQGFINYFGLQITPVFDKTGESGLVMNVLIIFARRKYTMFLLERFGSGCIPTYLIGATLLRGEWKNAIDLILDPREGEKDDIIKIRDYYKETGDVDGTLRQLPHHLVAERSILQCLRKSPTNYLQALKAIPRTLRMMYVHSYQSYLWNHAVSTRIQKYGVHKVILGDLVYCKEQCVVKESGSLLFNCEDDCLNITPGSDHLAESFDVDLPEETIKSVKAITEEDIVAGTFKVDDIVLPLPGSRVIYPNNDIAEVYNDLAKKDSISLTESAHNVKEFSITNMTGGYRQVFQKPKDFSWKILTYTDVSVPLAETDLDAMDKSRIGRKVIKEDLESPKETKKRVIDNEAQPDNSPRNPKLSGACTDAESGNIGSRVPNDLASDAQETQKALQLKFTLPTSSYATMAIRELLKTSTSHFTERLTPEVAVLPGESFEKFPPCNLKCLKKFGPTGMKHGFENVRQRTTADLRPLLLHLFLELAASLPQGNMKKGIS